MGLFLQKKSIRNCKNLLNPINEKIVLKSYCMATLKAFDYNLIKETSKKEVLKIAIEQ